MLPNRSTTNFGALLRQYRVAAGLTQEALAERAGLSVYGIQKLELGTTHPYRDTAARLASALRLTPVDADHFRGAVEPVRRRGSVRREQVSSSARRHNLPVALTSFVGREQEIAAVPVRLRTARLLTLTGVGGSGKTRLGIELARKVLDQYRDGVWLVELAQVLDPALVPDRVAAVVGVQAIADRNLDRRLVETLRESQMLLFVDNCEHVVEACAHLLDLLLRECPALDVLATSREPLGIPGEITWNVAPLATPDEVSASFAAIDESPAVRMFVARAATALPSFVLSDHNAGVVAQICRRLDGIPLALELAAARLDVLMLDELAARLDQRLSLLTSAYRGAPPRQQTLGATIDWSYQLLTETQQRVFERLSVFASGWTLDAAEAVCNGDSVAAEDTLEALLQLIRKSLVVRIDERHGRTRYGVLETLRQYALDKLQHRGGAELAETRQRHAAHYSTLVERLDAAHPTSLLRFTGETLELPIFEILEDVHDNVRVALRWWLEARRPTEGLVILRALYPFWLWHGIPVDGRRWMEAMLELAADSGETAGVQAALHAQTLMFGWRVAQLQADYATARRLIEASVAMWRTLDDDLGLAMAVSNQGIDYVARGEFETAHAILAEGLALARAGGDAFTLSTSLWDVGMALRAQGKHERAAAHLQESLVVAHTMERDSYRVYAEVRSLVDLARTESEQGASEQAIRRFKDALVRMRDSGLAGWILASCLDWMAAELRRAGDLLAAATLFGAADAQFRVSGVARLPIDVPAHERDLGDVRMKLGEEPFTQAWNEGRALDKTQLFAFVLGERR